MSGHVRSRRDRIGWRLDPVASTLARWTDDAPEVMRRLLTDDVLRRQLLNALEDVVGPADNAQVDETNPTASASGGAG